GATVLMASGLPLPPNVRGIVADCPYSSAKDIIIKVCRDMHIPPTLAYPFLALGARLYGGISLSKVTAAQAVKSAKVPIVIIHGEDDRFVPCDMSRDIELANPTLITRHTFPGAAHGLSFTSDFARYRGIVESMWNLVG
ncbi:MAG: alpha/beta hydrolase, partial [Clostridia bacterium]|nr:alpha/beta hydrolase [Clostridia bacterium]